METEYYFTDSIKTKYNFPGLSDARMLERALFPVEEVTDEIKKTFPALSPMEQEILAIEQEIPEYKDEDVIFCTPYVRTNTEGVWFVDLYFHFCDGNKRIIISPGYSMTEEDEAFFLYLFDINQYIVYNERIAGSFFNELQTVAEELHLQKYDTLVEVLGHAYFCSYPSGIRELLYKCGLSEIATYLEFIEEYNLMGSTIEETLGLPVSLLRKLNHIEAIETLLQTEENRRTVKEVYKKYHGMLNCYDTINSYQIRYLSSDFSKNEKVDKTVLKALSTIEEGYDEEGYTYIAGEAIYQEYMKYLMLLKSLGIRKKKHFPKDILLDPSHLSRLHLNCHVLEHCLNNTSYIDSFFELQEEWVDRYSFENDTYKIIVPESIADVLQEGEQQHNCLQDVLELDILEEDSIVLFIRDKKRPGKSLVTIEIREDRICQARRKYNANCLEEEKDFLLEFCKAKGVNPGALLEDDDESDDLDEPGEMLCILGMPGGRRRNMAGYMNIPTGLEDEVPFV